MTALLVIVGIVAYFVGVPLLWHRFIQLRYKKPFRREEGQISRRTARHLSK